MALDLMEPNCQLPPVICQYCDIGRLALETVYEWALGFVPDFGSYMSSVLIPATFFGNLASAKFLA